MARTDSKPGWRQTDRQEQEHKKEEKRESKTCRVSDHQRSHMLLKPASCVSSRFWICGGHAKKTVQRQNLGTSLWQGSLSLDARMASVGPTGTIHPGRHLPLGISRAARQVKDLFPTDQLLSYSPDWPNRQRGQPGGVMRLVEIDFWPGPLSPCRGTVYIG